MARWMLAVAWLVGLPSGVFAGEQASEDAGESRAAEVAAGVATSLATDDAKGAAVRAGAELASSAVADSLASGELRAGFYAGALGRAATASGNMGMMVGVRGGIVLNERIRLGVTGMLTVVDPLVPSAGMRNDRYLTFGYGGPEASVTVFSFGPADLSLRANFGVGGIGHNGTSSDAYVGTDLFFVAEPGLEVAVKVTDLLRVGIGAGYRFSFGTELEGLVPAEDGGSGSPADGLNVDLVIDFVLI